MDAARRRSRSVQTSALGFAYPGSLDKPGPLGSGGPAAPAMGQEDKDHQCDESDQGDGNVR